MASEKEISWIIVGFIIFITIFCIIFSLVWYSKLVKEKNQSATTGMALLSTITTLTSFVVSVIIYFTLQTRYDFGNNFCQIPLKGEKCCNVEQNCKVFTNPVCTGEGEKLIESTCINNSVVIPLTLSGTSTNHEKLTLDLYNNTTEVTSSFYTTFHYDEQVPVDVVCSIILAEGPSVGYCNNDGGVCIYIKSEFLTNEDTRLNIFTTMDAAYEASEIGEPAEKINPIDTDSDGKFSYSFGKSSNNNLFYYFSENKDNTIINLGLSSSTSLNSVFQEFNNIDAGDKIKWNLDAKTVKDTENRFDQFYGQKEGRYKVYNNLLTKAEKDNSKMSELITPQLFPCIDPGYSYPPCDNYVDRGADKGVSRFCINDDPTNLDNECVPVCFDPINYGNALENVEEFETATGRIVGDKEGTIQNSIFNMHTGDSKGEGLTINYKFPNNTKGEEADGCGLTGFGEAKGDGCFGTQPLTGQAAGKTTYPQSNIFCSNVNFNNPPVENKDQPFKSNDIATSDNDFTKRAYVNAVKDTNGDIILGFE